ncbi:MAG: hydrogenase expression/formation protein HypE [Candidatus Methanomethylicia archaeon]
MGVVTLAHGSGGIEMHEILNKLIFSRVSEDLKRVEGGVGIDELDDGALIPISNNNYVVISTDSYTVNPPFFPDGNIGILAASGSINDVLMMGGKPMAMLDSIIVEEGFPINELEVIVESFIKVLRGEGVALIGGDFKVMPKGSIDKIVINTTAIGLTDKPIIDKPKPGDKIIVSDSIGDHGAVIMLLQMGLEKSVEEMSKGLLKSDVKPLSKLMIPLIERYVEYINAARDPTRGGLSGVLNEWASKSNLVIVINESDIPIRESVKRYSEMLGIDPTYLANEGVAVISANPEYADRIVEYMRDLGFSNARIIGEVRESEKYKGYVLAKTSVGGFRVMEPPRGEIIPRIC